MKYEVIYEHTSCCAKYHGEQITRIYEVVDGAVAVAPIYCIKHGAELRIIATRVIS